MSPGTGDLVELVRMPAALTVPGDTVAGAATAGDPLGRRGALMPLASVSLYWAGMALNDYADRDLDAEERPERPIPSGRVSPAQALGLAGLLTLAGVGVASVAGGRRGLGVAVPLAGAVWSYDLLLKDTPAGPLAMASTRTLDVLLGAGGCRSALPAAVLAGLHTTGVTGLSRGEVHGGSTAAAGAALAATTVAALASAPRRPRGVTGAVGVALSTTYAWTVGRAQAAALRSPDAGTVRAATGAGILGFVPLQAALTARAGRPWSALALLAGGAAGRALTRRVSAT